MRSRYQVFNRDQGNVFPFVPAEPVPVLSETVVQNIDRESIYAKQQEARAVEHTTLDTSFVRYGALNPVVFPTAGISAPILTFRVPHGRKLTIRKVYIVYNEPFLYANNQIGWRISVDNGQIPFHNRDSVANSGQLTAPYTGISGDPELSPIFVQSNSLITIELVELISFGMPPVPIGDYIGVACYLFGELRKPIGGKN